MRTWLFIALLLFTFALFTGCPASKNQATDSAIPTGPETIVFRGPTIVSIEPDSLQIEHLKKKWGEESFYAFADDQIWYEDQLQYKAKLSDIELIQTQNTYLLLTDHQHIQQLVDSSSLKEDWENYFYYRPEKGLLQMNIDELSTLLETEKPTIEQVGIILEDIDARSTPGFDGQEKIPLKAGQMVQLRQQTQTNTGREDEAAFCYQNTWVQIRTEEGQEGWVFGKHLGKIQEESDLMAEYPSLKVMLDDEIYNVLLVRNYTIGASVEGEGLTGCEEFYPIVFMQNYYQKMELVKVSGYPHSDYPYGQLISDDSVEEKITAAETQGDHVRFSISCIYQDGTGAYTLEIRRKNGRLVGEVKGYQKLLE